MGLKNGTVLDLARVEMLLSTTGKGKAATDLTRYMILDDGSKVPFDTHAVGSWSGRRGEPRKYLHGDKGVIAYKA